MSAPRNRTPEPCITVYNAAAGSSFSTTATTLPLTQTHEHDENAFALASSEVTPQSTGTYRISWGVTLYGTTGTRTQGQSWVEVDGAELGGTRRMHYLRLANMGASGGGSMIVSLTAGQAVRLRSVRTLGGSCAALANGCMLTLERLS
jgi:hypothetical protein